MKRTLSLLLLLALVVMMSVQTALASTPVGGCPEGYTLENFMGHTGPRVHEGHIHAGVVEDTNGDGSICMKMVSPVIHVHVDNLVPLP